MKKNDHPRETDELLPAVTKLEMTLFCLEYFFEITSPKEALDKYKHLIAALREKLPEMEEDEATNISELLMKETTKAFPDFLSFKEDFEKHAIEDPTLVETITTNIKLKQELKKLIVRAWSIQMRKKPSPKEDELKEVLKKTFVLQFNKDFGTTELQTELTNGILLLSTALKNHRDSLPSPRERTPALDSLDHTIDLMKYFLKEQIRDRPDAMAETTRKEIDSILTLGCQMIYNPGSTLDDEDIMNCEEKLIKSIEKALPGFESFLKLAQEETRKEVAQIIEFPSPKN